jgi:uncharacterized membrane protein YhhN
MLNSLLLIIAFCLLTGLLRARKRDDRRQILVFKTTLSCLFVVVAVIQPHGAGVYFYLILSGLVLGLVGDVLLAVPSRKSFKAGLVAFLGGHVAYIAAFTKLAEPTDWLNPVLLAYAVSGAAVFWWIRPYLGSMLIPVGIYIAVIAVMMASACAVSLGPSLSERAALTLLLGSLFFGASDILAAKERFVKSRFLNRLIYLPLYYCGQFLIAFSVGMV